MSGETVKLHPILPPAKMDEFIDAVAQEIMVNIGLKRKLGSEVKPGRIGMDA